MTIEEARKILNLRGSLTSDDIRRAFRKMAKQYHPDRYQTFSQQAWATNRFRRIKEAYDFLTDSDSFDDKNRKGYDESFGEDKNSYMKNKTQDSDTGYGGFERPRSLFERLFDKFPSDKTIWGHIFWLLFIMPFFFVFIPYVFLLMTLQDIAEEKFGIKAYLGSRNKKEKFSFLIISTISALVYLPIFYWMSFTKSGEISPTTLRIILGILSSTMVIIFVLSEWVGFLLATIWSRTIESELQKWVPIS